MSNRIAYSAKFKTTGGSTRLIEENQKSTCRRVHSLDAQVLELFDSILNQKCQL